MAKIDKIHKILDSKDFATNVKNQELDPAPTVQQIVKKKVENKDNVAENTLSEEEQIKTILSKSIIVDPEQSDSLGKEFVAMAKEYTDPKNRYIFGQTTQMFVFEDSLLGANAEEFKNSNDQDLKDLGKFIENFRYWYHTGRGAIKGQMRQDFTEFGSSLLAFRGALEWRNAGIRDQGMDPEKRSLWDRLKK